MSYALSEKNIGLLTIIHIIMDTIPLLAEREDYSTIMIEFGSCGKRG
jgi:hypothetical protein